MFSIKTTKNNLGITITGDYRDLNKLHTGLSNLVGYEEEIEGYEDISLRILGICYDLRHAYMGDREIELVHNGINDEIKKWHGKLYPDYNVYYSVNILWIEAIFSALVLEDIINIRCDKRLSKKYIVETEDFWIPDDMDREEIEKKVKIEKEIRLPYDIAIVRLYQASIWKALNDVVGINRYRRLRNLVLQDGYYGSLKYHGFFTQYLDILNMEYIYGKPEKRNTSLAALIRKLIKLDKEYYDIEEDIREFAKENDIDYRDVQLTNVNYPEELEW